MVLRLGESEMREKNERTEGKRKRKKGNEHIKSFARL
jgi:hypothetical protein